MYIHTYVYPFLSGYPAGHLRHRAYRVLCFGVTEAQRKQTHKTNIITNSQINNAPDPEPNTKQTTETNKSALV